MNRLATVRRFAFLAAVGTAGCSAPGSGEEAPKAPDEGVDEGNYLVAGERVSVGDDMPVWMNSRGEKTAEGPQPEPWQGPAGPQPEPWDGDEPPPPPETPGKSEDTP